MRGANCSNCGRRQDVKLGKGSKASCTCPECGKPLMVRRDRDGIAVKAFDNDSESEDGE